MKIEYIEWIRKFLENNNPKRKCKEAVNAMNLQFPELMKVRGHVKTILSENNEPHWWLVDTDRNIIDPTSSQFLVIIEYIPHDETQPEPTGKCPNCGNYCYNYSSVCSDKCGEEYKRYFNT
ncbi:MAG: hypothetical protein WC623_22105 [Pedobacter sp.]|uniref:hypothetical protein n=1 Tax=Pedobacter sp. TaxID=1411316 RepID=UPI00356A5D56